MPRNAQIPSLLLALTAFLLVSSPGQSGEAGTKGAPSTSRATTRAGSSPTSSGMTGSGTPTLASSPGSPIIGAPATTETTSPSDTGSDTTGHASQGETDARPGPGIQEGRSENGDAKPDLFHERHVPSGE